MLIVDRILGYLQFTFIIKKDQIATKTLIIKQTQSSGDILSSSSNFALGFTLTLVRFVLLMLDGGQTVDKISCIMMVAFFKTLAVRFFWDAILHKEIGRDCLENCLT